LFVSDALISNNIWFGVMACNLSLIFDLQARQLNILTNRTITLGV